MLPLTVIHDLDVLQNPSALISLAACRNSHIPYDTNANYPQLIGCSELANISPAVTDSNRRIQSP